MRATRNEFDQAAARHRAEIVAFCYRMLGSLADAEDVTQDTFARAWRAREQFAGKASLRTWLFRIATNACLDQLRARPRRTLPRAVGRAADPGAPVPPALEAARWIGPYPDRLRPDTEYAAHESITLAFMLLLHHLTPRQRAVLVARDVLGWDAAEVASQLGASVPAVEALLHRARATMRGLPRDAAPPVDDPGLLARYVAAWTAGDPAALRELLAEDSTFSMPPQPAWYRGRDAIAAFVRAHVFVGDGVRWRLAPTRANGCPAFAVFRAAGRRAAFAPHAIHVVEQARGAITAITCFLEPELVARFGNPEP